MTLLSEVVNKFEESDLAKYRPGNEGAWEYVKSDFILYLKDSLHSLLRELDGEVEGMKRPTPICDSNYHPKTAPDLHGNRRCIICDCLNTHNSALSDVQDKIKSYLK